MAHSLRSASNSAKDCEREFILFKDSFRRSMVGGVCMHLRFAESFSHQLVTHGYTLGWLLRRSGRERLKMIKISGPRFRGGRDRHLVQHRMCRRPGNELG